MSDGGVSFIDLEGVLTPEMWPYLAEVFDIEDLVATTREEPDYRRLVDGRIAALERHGIPLDMVRKAISRLEPFEGAIAFVAELRRHGAVILVSDSFRPMNTGLIERFSFDGILCHRFRTDHRGMIRGTDYWNNLEGKHKCFSVHASAVPWTFAVGDALNDIGMIRSATGGVLFRPSSGTQLAAPDIVTASTYLEVIDLFKHMSSRYQSRVAPA